MGASILKMMAVILEQLWLGDTNMGYSVQPNLSLSYFLDG